ncbi:hypothetical protein ACO0QE_001271 [Hanseniaspora vineae]
MDKRARRQNSSLQHANKKVKKSGSQAYGLRNEGSNEGDRLEYRILQGYRTMDSEMVEQRLEIDRGAGINLAMEKLKNADELFSQAGALMKDPEKSNNTILAYDSRALLNISELAQSSVRNLKLDEAKQNINSIDVINGMKKWMLEEYLEETGLDHNLIDTDEEGGNSDSDNNGAEVDGDEPLTQADIDKRLMTKRLKERSKLAKYEPFKQFEQFNWLKLGTLYRNISRKPNVADHLLGPLQVEKKARAASKPRVRDDPIGKEVTAKNMSNEDMNAKGAATTEEFVRACFKILKKKKGYESINLFEFIIDPDSFSKTVENLFYTSFLIRDGKLIMEEDEDGYPQIRIMPPAPKDPEARALELQKRNEKPLSHLIFQLDIPTYERLKQEFNITESFIGKV